ncbi:Retrovirus-related Pol polyprotein from transposon TNT 1-94-like protein, partial [Drosera capensis]
MVTKRKRYTWSRLKDKLVWFEKSTSQWYRKFESFLVDNGYKKTSSDSYFFIQKFPLLHHQILTSSFKTLLSYCFMLKICRLSIDDCYLKGLGPTRQIFISCDRKKRKLWLSQERYMEK